MVALAIARRPISARTAHRHERNFLPCFAFEWAKPTVNYAFSAVLGHRYTDTNHHPGVAADGSRIGMRYIDRLQTDIQAEARHAAGFARQAAFYAGLWTAFSLLFGVVVAMTAAVFARNQDERDADR